MVAKNRQSAQSSDVAVVEETPFSEGVFDGVSSYQDIMSILQREGVEVVNALDVLGDGFPVVEDKDKLVKQSMILVDWKFWMGEYGEAVYVRGVTTDGRKFAFIDGSTGICQQLSKYSAKTGKCRGMAVPGGLVRSDYTFTDDSGNEKAAKTYYLATS